MLGKYLRIADGEYAGNMGGESFTMDGEQIGTMGGEYLGANDGGHSRTRAETVLESWTGNMVQHEWIIPWSHG